MPTLQDAISLHQSGDLAGAAEAYEYVLKDDSDNLDVMNNLGSVYRQLNLPDKAEQQYQQVLERTPDAHQARFNLGNLYYQWGRWRGAITVFSELSVVDEFEQACLLQVARCHRELLERAKALEAFIAANVRFPDNIDILLELGNLHYYNGDNDAAIACFSKIVGTDSEHWKAHYSLARVYDSIGKTNSFQTHYEIALNLTPKPLQVRQALAKTRFNDARFADAASEFLIVIEQDDDQPYTKVALGACLIHLDKKIEADKIFQEVTLSSDIHVLNDLAKTIWEYKYFDETLQILKKIVQLSPELADVHLNLAKAEFQMWNLAAAERGFNKALSLNPKLEEAEDLMADLYVRQGRADKAYDIYKEQLRRPQGLTKSASTVLFTQLYCEEDTVLEKATYHKKLMTDLANTLPPFRSIYQPKKQPNRKLKIGFVSADFRDQHPVGILIQAFLAHVDIKKFTVKAYYNAKTFDESTHRIKGLVQDWQDCEAWSDAKLQQCIAQDEIDILVDLSGHTSKNRLSMFANRAAPVQVSWLGYPHSSGLENMDVLLGDEVATPSRHAELFSEQIVEIKGHCVFCLENPDEYAKPKQRSASAPLVLGSFNNLSKITRSTLVLWCEVLNAIPEAHFKMKTPSFTDTKTLSDVKGFFVSRGVDQTRLDFSGPVALEDMMNEYNDVDIALDPLNYNGGMTTIQALTMGVPVVTLEGENFCGRMGASILTAASMSDWVAPTKAEYIALVQAKSADLVALRKFKFAMRAEAKKLPLFDALSYAKSVSKALRTTWKAYCKGEFSKSPQRDDAAIS